MKHLIVGSGVVGVATGKWLVANNEDVLFFDIKRRRINNLKKEGYKATRGIKGFEKQTLPVFDLVWICTNEWDAEKAIEQVKKLTYNIIIRSTLHVGTTDKLIKKYDNWNIAHIPEFLKEKTAIDDMFNPDRVVIGVRDGKLSKYDVWLHLMKIYETIGVPVIVTNPLTSEIVKYASNCWLATQISFWNEVNDICKQFDINPQAVANITRLDKRISSYGTSMLGSSFSGACLVKDLDAFIKRFKEKNIKSTLLKAVKERNK